MFCQKCGNENDNKAAFCKSCGAPLNVTQVTQPQPELDPVSAPIPVNEPFYKKMWFIVLMLIFIAPVGIVLLWLFGKPKQNTKIILSVVFAILFLIVILPKTSSNSKSALSVSSASPFPSSSLSLEATAAPTNESTVSPTIAPTEKPTQAPTTTPNPTPTPSPAFKKSKVTVPNIEAAIKELFKDSEYVSTDVTTEKGKTIVDVYFKPTTFWDEKDFVRQTGYQATLVMQVLFTNPKIDKVWVWAKTDMTDAKANTTEETGMNICLTKENAADINWEKFKENAYIDYKALINIADSYYIHPGILKNIKD